MDRQIMRDLFDGVISASMILDVDADFRAAVQAARGRLMPDRIGKAGQLQEWAEDWDTDAPEPHHRHVSHLYGLYPSLQIRADTAPALVAAARKSLELRGDEATGWGLGWRLNLWARLRDGKRAANVLTRLLSPDRSYPNLFDAHPPFQIDGNFGGASGIIEMLVQSRVGEVLLLPALSPNWANGEIKGVRARGGIEVEVSWKGGTLRGATFRGARDGLVKVFYQDLHATLVLIDGKPGTVRLSDGVLVTS
jgi:alpha-L-fucosidase 2